MKTRLSRRLFACIGLVLLAPGALAQRTPIPLPIEYPNASNTGHLGGGCPGWAAEHVVDGALRITEPGVYEKYLVNGYVLVQADDVTIRCSHVEGTNAADGPSFILNCLNGRCSQNLRLEWVTISKGTRTTTNQDISALGDANYYALRVKIDNVSEGFRAGAIDEAHTGSGPIIIVNSFARVRYPDVCNLNTPDGINNWHGDGLQGYFGGGVTIRNVTLDLVNSPSCGGTSPFFWPSGQGNIGTVDIVKLLVVSTGQRPKPFFSFRLGTPANRVQTLMIGRTSYLQGPIDVKCSVAAFWSAQKVTINSAYQPTALGAVVPCDTEEGD
jgi:hypothetical protein